MDDTTGDTPIVEQGHAPHKHAVPRVVIALGAVLLVIVAGVVWSRWGTAIKEACLGKEGACTVELPPETTSGALTQPFATKTVPVPIPSTEQEGSTTTPEEPPLQEGDPNEHDAYPY
jgi:hypothetical protein